MYHEWDASPITGISARIQRGFHRVALGAAVLVALFGLAVTAAVAVMGYTEAEYQYRYANYRPYALTSSSSDWMMRPVPTWVADAANKRAYQTAYLGAFITCLAGFAAFGAFRGLGWVLAGFARD